MNPAPVVYGDITLSINTQYKNITVLLVGISCHLKIGHILMSGNVRMPNLNIMLQAILEIFSRNKV